MEEPRPGERQKSRREVDSPWSALPRRGSLSQRRRTTQRWPLQSGYLSLHSVSSATETSPVQHSLGTERLALEAFDACRAVGQLEQVAVGKSVGELLLVRYQQDAPQLAAQVLQLLNHHLTPLTIQTAKTLVDDDRLDWPVLPARILSQTQRQADRHAETLRAAQERHVDRRLSRAAVVGLQFQRLVCRVAVVAATQPQVELTARQPIQHRIGVIDHLPLRLPHQVTLQPVASQELGQQVVTLKLRLGFQQLLLHLLALLPLIVEDRPRPLRLLKGTVAGRLYFPRRLELRQHLVGPQSGLRREAVALGKHLLALLTERFELQPCLLQLPCPAFRVGLDQPSFFALQIEDRLCLGAVGLLLPLRRQFLTDALHLLQTHPSLCFLGGQPGSYLGLVLLKLSPLFPEPVHLLPRRLFLLARCLDARCQRRIGRFQVQVLAANRADILRQIRLQARQRLPRLIALRLQLLPATLLRVHVTQFLAYSLEPAYFLAQLRQVSVSGE